MNMGAVTPHPAPKRKANKYRRVREGIYWNRRRDRIPKEKQILPTVKVTSLPPRSENHPQKNRKPADKAPMTAKREAAQILSIPRSTRYFIWCTRMI
jgi:hypothetical protein